MIHAILLLIVLGYMTYGIVHIVKNKSLSRVAKFAWIAAVICFPVLGTSFYLHSSFEERHGRW